MLKLIFASSRVLEAIFICRSLRQDLGWSSFSYRFSDGQRLFLNMGRNQQFFLKKGMIMAACLCSVIGIILNSVAMGTNNWILSEGSRKIFPC